MAGQPKMRAFEEDLKKRYGSKDDPTGEDHVMELIADGYSMEKAAKATGCTSRQQLQNWVKRGGQRRRDKLEAARKASADTLVEDGMNILDGLANKRTPLTQPQVTLGAQRAGYRKWLASMRNREAFGEEKAATVNINLNSLHLDALRQAGSMESAQIEDAEFKLLPEGSDGEDGSEGDDSEGCGDRSPVRTENNDEPERD
jgi:transposase-like protein